MPRSMVNMQVNCIPPGRPRVGQVYHFPPQPPSPITPKTYTSKRTVTLEGCSYRAPRAGPLRGRRTDWPAATAADPEKMHARLRSLPTSTRFLMGLRSRPTSTRFSQHIAMLILKPSRCFK